MFVKNSFEYDARVTREAQSLIRRGHEVTVVALLAPRVTPEFESRDDGLTVVRVPRSSLGVPTLNRIAARYAGTIEARHARLTGEMYDEARAAELGRFSAPSTATPGDDLPAAPSQMSEAGRPTAASRLWGAVTTPLLRSVARFARFTFRGAKRLLGRQGSRLQHWAIDRRMVKAGLAEGADVYHCHDLNTLAVGVACKRKSGAVLVYDSHELQTERNRMTAAEKQRAVEAEGAGLGHVDALIVASEPWIEWNRRLHGSVPERSTAILNVPDLADVIPLDLHGVIGVAPERKLVVYQGSIQENRGIEPAIDAVASMDGVVLVIIGYGHHRPVLERQVRERGLDDVVKFFGPVPNDELLAYTASADVGLCNIVNSSVSYYTTLPNKLFEYVMAGTPVIGSDSPEIGRVVRETGTGEVCDPEDPQALAAAIERILEDPAPYLARMPEARARYNWGVEEEKLIALYEGFSA